MEKTLEKTLDVRDMVPKERHPMIFDTFKALGPGESFVLVNDHDPKPLLYQFQNEHDGEFDWWPLEQGPLVWRVTIERRKTSASNTLGQAPDPDRTITDYFQTDHMRLDGIYNRFYEAFKGQLWDGASADFREFSLGLKRHIKVEEEILFPVFEEKTGMHDAGPTFVMKSDHKEIKELLDKILASTDAKNEAEVSKSSYLLTSILSEHNMKEEHILYPESDSFLTEAERAQVVKKAQAA